MVKSPWINTLRPRQNGCHFADDTFKPIFLNENIRISPKISLKFVPKGPINNIPALVQIMAWRRPGGKPLFEAMVVSFARPQWVNKHHMTQTKHDKRYNTRSRAAHVMLTWYIQKAIELTIKKSPIFAVMQTIKPNEPKYYRFPNTFLWCLTWYQIDINSINI